MRKPTFPERSAHLSYVAPLIGVIIVRQLGTPPAALVLLALLLAGGLFSAFTGLRWARKERAKTSLPALLGIAANLAFVVWVVATQLPSGGLTSTSVAPQPPASIPASR